MVPKKVKSGQQTMLVLPAINAEKKQKIQLKVQKSNGKTIEHSPKHMVSVIDKENQLSVLPTIQVTCPRCEKQ